MGEMVTITRAEYDLLREAAEDLRDLRAYDNAKAQEAESFPADLVNRMLAGENPVKLYREHRGLTGADLAREAGIHRVQIHDIESGKRRGSIDTLKAIAVALHVDLELIA